MDSFEVYKSLFAFRNELSSLRNDKFSNAARFHTFAFTGVVFACVFSIENNLALGFVFSCIVSLFGALSCFNWLEAVDSMKKVQNRLSHEMAAIELGGGFSVCGGREISIWSDESVLKDCKVYNRPMYIGGSVQQSVALVAIIMHFSFLMFSLWATAHLLSGGTFSGLLILK